MSINRLPLYIGKCCGALVFIIGLIVLIGWHTHVKLLIQLNPSTPMQFNTAICFVFAGIGLIAVTYNNRVIAFACSLVIGAISCITILQYLLQIDFGLDTLFFNPTATSKVLNPGRMASITAWGFFVAALMLISTCLPGIKLRFLAIRLAASVILILGLVPLAGYLSDVEMAYSLGQLTHIAFFTAIAFILLGIGANAYTWHIDMLKNGSLNATWYSSLGALVVFLYTLTLWQQSINKENRIMQDKIHESAHLIQHNISEQINNAVVALSRMVNRWQDRGGTPKSEWCADAKNYLLDIKTLHSIAWINSAYQVQWIEPLIESGNNIVPYPRDEKQNTAANRVNVPMTAPLTLPNGERGFIVYLPIDQKQNFQGFIASIFNVNKLIKGAMPAEMNKFFNITLTYENEPMYSSAINKFEFTKPYQLHFKVLDKQWTLKVSPKDAFFNPQVVPYWELLGGSIFALLMGMAIYYALIAVQRLKQLTEKSKALSISEKRKQLLEMEKSRLLVTIDESPDYIGMADIDGNLLYHNQSARKMAGITQEDMFEMKITDMHPAWAYKLILGQAIPTVLSKGVWSGETALIHHPSGREIPVMQTLVLHRDEQKKPMYLTTIMRDMTERKKFEAALKTSEETFRLAMDYAAIGMALVSLDGHFLKVNKSLCQIVGYSETELLDMSIQDITHPDDLDADLNKMTQVLAGKINSYQIEKRYIHKNGATVWILLSGSVLRNTETKPLNFIAQIQNIDKQKELERELRYLANNDALTGLFNRKQLGASFKLAVGYAKRHKTQIAFMFLDLDYFKTINDKFGHEIGDFLLVEVAARLKASVRATDILFRLGGDEFVIFINELTTEEFGIAIAKKILTAVAAPMNIKHHQITITASIGISFFPQDGSDLDTLIKHADNALYAVKSEGRNNFRVFSSV